MDVAKVGSGYDTAEEANRARGIMRDERDKGTAPEHADGRDYRSIPVEELRRFTQDQAELTSIRQVAAEVGVGRTTLHKFAAGETTPHPRVRRLLGLWYLRRTREARQEASAAPYAAAMEILLSSLPAEARQAAATELLSLVEARYAASGAERPPWLDALRAQLGVTG
jgi:hypothetical protein